MLHSKIFSILYLFLGSQLNKNVLLRSALGHLAISMRLLFAQQY